ncbi:MAG: ASKHA domain-containing protein [Candidatus Sumerlaeaceae bacterium]|nr:ASKHA domain-containing protein [Candidatus Sumerlaeaceae bacterium]
MRHKNGFPLTVDFFDKRTTRILPKGIPLTDALAACGCIVEQPCGGRGTCGKCLVRFIKGAPNPTLEEKELLKPEMLADGWRLSCRHSIREPCHVSVTVETQISAWKEFGPAGKLISQLPRFRTVKLPLTRSDHTQALLSWEEKILRTLASEYQSLQLTARGLRELANAIGGSCNTSAEALVLDDALLLGVGDYSYHPPLGLAVDLGTTTIAAALINLLNGEMLASEEIINPQVQCGYDIISRISSGRDGGELLHNILIESLNKLSMQLFSKIRLSLSNLYATMCVGNSFMLHTLLGVNPSSLGFAPYLPVWRSPFVSMTRLPNFHDARETVLMIPPILGGHVGADTAAAVVASELDKPGPPRLLMDLGTNCEIVLAFEGRLLVASAAAGPAFEGRNIRCGMRAKRGALDRVASDAEGDLWVHTLGGGALRGICGAGLIDLVSLLLDQGLITPDGRLRSRDEAQLATTPCRMLSRLVKLESGESAFTISPLDAQQPVYLTAGDIRQLQLAKAAIRAAIEILCEEAALCADQLQAIYITGQFGTYVKKSALLRLNILPPVKPGKVQIIPNAAGWGARLLMIDYDCWRRALSLLEKVEHLDLAHHPHYADNFAEATRF